MPAAVEPVCIGPTWQRSRRHPSGYRYPKRTLGWSALYWAFEWLQLPTGEPWLCTPEQERFVCHWYAVDSRGRFLYRDGVLQRLKGWGKDPLGAVLCAIEFLGPCRCDDSGATVLDPWGNEHPAGVPHPQAWVQTAAVSKDQTRTTMTIFPWLFSKAAVAEYGIDLGKEIIYADHGARRIEAVTSSPRALEGARSTFVLRNEALAVDTSLPSPEGWIRVGDVQPGDVLFGSRGPVLVSHVTPVYEGRDCYRVTFEDGTSLVTDDGHLWLTKLTCSAALPKIRTTGEMFRDRRRFAVPLCGALDAEHQQLPLDPYVLGLWLGDGDRRAATISAGAQDADELLEAIKRRGVPAARFTKTAPDRARLISLQGNQSGDRYTKDGSSFRGGLAALGLLGNKHIPSSYLRGSAEQRLELLRGLMDSDGCASDGRAIFVNQSEVLARDVVELARSLGYRVALGASVDTRWSRPRRIWRVTFRADERVNPFRLRRKAIRVHGLRRPWKSIVSIEPVASTPVKCIEVAAADHLFVAGDGWTLTHNTQHWISTNEGHQMDRVIARNLGKSKDGQARALSITNAYEPGEESVAQLAREAWEGVEAGRIIDSGMLYDSLEAPPEARLCAEEAPAVLEAVRGDAHWLDIERLVQEILDPRNPPSQSRRFYYNQVVAVEDAWVTPQEWDALAQRGVKIAEGEQVALGFDGSLSDDHTALMGCRIEDGYTFTLGVWDPARTGNEAPRAAIDRAVRAAFEQYDVVAFFSDLHPWESYVDRWMLELGGKLCAAASARHKIAWDMRARQKEFTLEGAERTHNEITEGAFRHDGDARVRQHVHNARRRPNAWGVSFGKEHRESSRKVDALAALILARMARRAYLALPKQRQRRKRQKAAFY